MNIFKNKLKKRLSLKQELRLLKKVMPAIFQFDFEFRFFPVIKYSLVPLLIMLMVVLPAFAYASPSVNQGHWLFPIKKVIENIEFEVASEEEKVEKLEKFAERRLDEVEYIVASEDYKSEIVVTTLEEVQVINHEIKVKEPQGRTGGQQQTLEIIAQSVGLEATDEVVDEVALTLEESKTKKQKTKKRFDFTWPNLSNEDEEESEELEKNFKYDSHQVLKQYKKDFDDYFKDIKTEEDDDKNEKKEQLKEKVYEKFKKVEKELEDGNKKEAQGLLKATEALGNNAEHFMNWNNDNDNDKWNRKKRGGELFFKSKTKK